MPLAAISATIHPTTTIRRWAMHHLASALMSRPTSVGLGLEVSRDTLAQVRVSSPLWYHWSQDGYIVQRATAPRRRPAQPRPDHRRRPRGLRRARARGVDGGDRAAGQ